MERSAPLDCREAEIAPFAGSRAEFLGALVVSRGLVLELVLELELLLVAVNFEVTPVAAVRLLHAVFFSLLPLLRRASPQLAVPPRLPKLYSLSSWRGK